LKISGGDGEEVSLSYREVKGGKPKYAFPASYRYDRKIKSTQTYKLGIIFNCQLPQK